MRQNECTTVNYKKIKQKEWHCTTKPLKIQIFTEKTKLSKRVVNKLYKPVWRRLRSLVNWHLSHRARHLLLLLSHVGQHGVLLPFLIRIKIETDSNVINC
jgi:hypothetical protein